MNTPPKYPLRFLRWFCREDYIDEIEGDLIELFEKRAEESTKMARRRFVWDVLKSFRIRNIKSSRRSQNSNYTAMVRHTLLLSFRNFKKYKSSFLINLTGLSSGLACVLLIYLWVNDELGVDKFGENDDRLFQVMHNLKTAQGALSIEVTPTPLAEALVNEMPEVQVAVAVNDLFNWQGKKGILSNGDRVAETKALIAGRDFFHVMPFKLLEGNKEHVLADRKNIVVSESFAKLLFNSTENTLGKSLEWDHSGFKGTFQVAGIFEDIPSNSTL